MSAPHPAAESEGKIGCCGSSQHDSAGEHLVITTDLVITALPEELEINVRGHATRVDLRWLEDALKLRRYKQGRDAS